VVYTIDEIKAKIEPIAKRYNVSKVYLFGSYARGEEDENSDIDIALELGDITEYNEVTQNAIKESLEKYKTEGITKSSESIDNYFERMVRENTK